MEFREFIIEGDMRYQALGMAKSLHNKLAQLSFLEMLSVMSPDNPAKKEVQELETKINDLTTEVGGFIQKYIPDVADAEGNELDELPKEEPEEEEPEKEEEPAEPKEKPEKKEKVNPKDKEKNIKDNEKEVDDEKKGKEKE